MTSADKNDLITWAKGEIERRRTLLEKSSENDAEHRGAISAHRALLDRLDPPKHEQLKTPDYDGFGESGAAPAY